MSGGSWICAGLCSCAWHAKAITRTRAEAANHRDRRQMARKEAFKGHPNPHGIDALKMTDTHYASDGSQVAGAGSGRADFPHKPLICKPLEPVGDCIDVQGRMSAKARKLLKVRDFV